ncbi:hypothetical protein N0Y54_17430 [Nostoc punctiforme UO1]|uniref:hypothetical protein n=1 Tax=Nostoc punctiforme TaxID=272131 RepID=UPI003095CDBA
MSSIAAKEVFEAYSFEEASYYRRRLGSTNFGYALSIGKNKYIFCFLIAAMPAVGYAW